MSDLMFYASGMMIAEISAAVVRCATKYGRNPSASSASAASTSHQR
jgi:hypothetical protein